jgi:hypothetical protein
VRGYFDGRCLKLREIPKVRFTSHAREKFEFIRRYGFNIGRESVVETVLNPDRLDERGDQRLALRVLDESYALRVVYEERKGYLVVITFYPVRRDRFGV